MSEFERIMWTTGYGNRTINGFTELLKSHSIDTVVDIRMFPASSTHGHFQRDSLRGQLNSEGIDFHCAGHHFGAMREVSEDSPHVALGESLRGFAEYMSTATFKQGIKQLIDLAAGRNVVLVDEPTNFEECHRKLLADYLYIMEGYRVFHIQDVGTVQEHFLTSSARVQFNTLVYDSFEHNGITFH